MPKQKNTKKQKKQPNVNGVSFGEGRDDVIKINIKKSSLAEFTKRPVPTEEEVENFEEYVEEEAREEEIEERLNEISNDQSIVLADNFCTTNWDKLKEKQLYNMSTLSPGPFCFSEAESRDLNQILKKYGVGKVIITYDTEKYLEFISNFIQYLEENDVEYMFVQSENEIKI